MAFDSDSVRLPNYQQRAGRVSAEKEWRPVRIIAILLLGYTFASGQTQAPSADQGVAARQAETPAANPQAVALAEFQKRLRAYLDLRRTLSGKLKPLASTSDAAQLATRQDTLAAAIREARKDAKPGDVIPTRVAGQIRTVVAADFRQRNASTKRAVLDEVPGGIRPAVNNTMPDTAALATVPPLLLNDLPPLPDNLQYRFMDRHVVLRDGDTRIIVDYILNVLPTR
jgi:hypothetical protein